MMMRTKVFCLALCLALLLAAMPVALGEAAAPAQTRRLRLGSSIYTLEIDDSFDYGPVTEEDVAEGQVAYLFSGRFAVDFDVYQRGGGSEQLPLAEYVAESAAARGNADEVVPEGEINGIPVGWFHTVETFEDIDYQTVTYVLDDGEDFVEITFWLDGEDAEAVVQGMINTLDYENLAPVRLGTSPYWVFCSASFREGGMTSEDIADDQVAYWVSDETLLDFDVYQFTKEDLPERLADYVASEAEAYNASAFEPETAVNDIPMGWYRTEEEWEGQTYPTLTCVLDSGTEYVEIVFWLDGLTAGAEADAIIKSLWMDDAPEAEADSGEAADLEESGLDAALAAPDDGFAPEGEDVLDAAGEQPVEAAGEAVEAGQAPAEAAEATRRLRLGSSAFTMAVPASYVEGELTQEDIDDDQVGYYYSNESLMDFDIYQFSKDGYPNDLATFVQEECSGFNEVSELVTSGEVNGIPAGWYRTVEEYQDTRFNTLTYILDDGEEYVEVCFWLDGENADAEVDAIIRTLSRDEAGTPGDEGAAVEPVAEPASAQRTSAEVPEAEADGYDAAQDGAEATGAAE